MKKKICLVLMLLLFTVIPVNATSGRLKGNSITSCNGVLYGSHGDGHWHQASLNSNGTYNAVGDPLPSNPCAYTPPPQQVTPYVAPQETVPEVKEDPKDSDTSLKSVKVNGTSVVLSESMTHTTEDTDITIEVVATKETSKLEYQKSTTLVLGENKFVIKVIAEDESTKEYNLLVTREEKPLSNDTRIDVKINGERIDFEDGKATYSRTEDISLRYSLLHEKASTTLDDSIDLNQADSAFITFSVTAEDGTIQKYSLNIVSDVEETNSDIGAVVFVSFIMFTALGAGVTFLILRQKYQKQLKEQTFKHLKELNDVKKEEEKEDSESSNDEKKKSIFPFFK